MSTSGMHGESFRLGYRFQCHWDTPMANAFFCGEFGAGTFVVALLVGYMPGMALGLLVTGIGKPFFHLTHMGVPGKSWRAILRPDRSWTSRGLIAIIVFTGAGVVHVVDSFLGGALPGGLALATTVMAGVAALAVMTYQGFAMSHSTAIALWSTAMMPFSSLLYALAGGTTVVLLMHGSGAPAEVMARLTVGALGLIGSIAMMLAALLHAAYHGGPGARVSARLLMHGQYAPWLHGVVVAAGLVLPAAALWLAGGTFAGRLVAAAGVLGGFYAYRVLMFKAGVYEPVMSFTSLTGGARE